jgi:hypothetical protein
VTEKRAPMASTSFTLDIDEFAAMVGFLNAKKIVGMDERLFDSFTEANLPHVMAKLQARGLMEPADRPDSWHTNEDLFETLAVVVAPHFAILGRSKAQPMSILFYAADDDLVQIIVTSYQVIVTKLADENALGASLVTFLSAAFPAEIVVARVNGEAFDAGRVALVDERGTVHTTIRSLGPEAELPWNEATIVAFVRGAMDELVQT